MTPFEEDAYLTPDLDAFERRLRLQYGNLDRVFREACRIVVALMQSTAVDPGSGRDILVFGLAARIVEHSQATHQLAFRGMRESGRATLRCALECLFALVALVRARKNYRRVRLKYLLERRRTLRYVVERHGALDHAGNDVTGALQRVERQIHRFAPRNRNVTVPELARLAGLTDVYELRYQLYSAAVHPDPIDIADEHAAPGALRFEPSDDVDLQLRESLETLGKTAMALISHFALDDTAYQGFRPTLVATLNA